ncbi:murein transglycosylase domain-containing protein [Pseudoalteromonas citrea]|nr:murein transglycosylase domain-containing protein [Pseudoalteromonas citrea]
MQICLIRAITVMLAIFWLTACQSTLNLQSAKEIKKLAEQIQKNPHDVAVIAEGINKSQQSINQDMAKIQRLFGDLDAIIEQVWGKSNKELPSNTRYVKYSNDYEARAIVDFVQGSVTIETIATKNIKPKLSQAIFETLLTSDDPSQTDIFSSQSPTLSGEPFLYPQVRDQDGQVVRYEWRAKRYASYLVANNLTTSQQNGRKMTQVTFNLVTDHKHLRHLKYSDSVLASAKKYNISAALIYAVIETESAFNPYAVSHANAYGLMQVVPATAGRDVYKLEKNRAGQPTKSTLMSPQQNIDIGTAYLKILNTRYLAGVKHQLSREYTIISAYNGGAGNVFKTYHPNRTTAVKKINQQSPANVYKQLRYDHPRDESRRYLEKVTKAKQKYL